MSHFSVIVIGENVEQQLAPYHEFECTGTNDQYVQDVDVTEELAAQIADGSSLEDALDYYGLADKIVASEAEVQKVGDDCPHKYGYAIVQDGKLIKAVNRSNPNKQWDWWVVGGRWSGFLRAKPEADAKPDTDPTAPRKGSPGLMGAEADPTGVDVALKGDVDFDAMRDEAGAKAATLWDKAAAAKVAAGLAENATWTSWADVREQHPGNIDAARKAYNAQPAIQALEAVSGGSPFFNPDQFLASREVYVQAARDKACVPYAVVKDGQWIAKGEMGWFGMSDEKVSQEDWNRKVNDLFDSLPDDTLLTVVDCHI